MLPFDGVILWHFYVHGLCCWPARLEQYIIAGYTSRFFMTAFLTVLLCSPVAFLATAGRGIVASLGFVIVTLIMAQFAAILGIGPYFPWSIAGVYSVSNSVQGMHLVGASYIIKIVTFLAGCAGTAFLWWYSDQH